MLGQVPIDGGRNALWECRCICEKVIVTTSLALRKGHTTSCGCKRALNMRKVQEIRVHRQLTAKTDLEMATGRAFYEYRSTAKKLRRVFELSRIEFSTLVQCNCHYCGAAPFAGFSPRSPSRSKVLLNGVDRINSKMGYVRGNVVPCCKHCNRAKLEMTDVEFIALCRRVAEHHSQEVRYGT